MNKNLKYLVIGLNVTMLAIGCYWLYGKPEPEPLIVVCGQISVLVCLIFEKTISKILTKSVSESDVKIRSKQGDEIHTERITKGSNVDIDTRG